jgi:hypothetical protein
MGARVTRTARLRSLLALLAAVGVVLAAVTTEMERTRAAGATSSHRLTLRGSARGLYPGAERWVRIVVRNRTDRDVRLLRLSRRVTDAPAGCPTRALWIGRPRSLPVIAAGGRARIRVRVRMRRSAPDACQGAVFRVRFRARGVAA